MNWPMRFGVFLAPFNPVGQHPTVALEKDLELVEWMDRWGYDEAWIGEHHSGGYEIIASQKSSLPLRPSGRSTSVWVQASAPSHTTTPTRSPSAWSCSTT